MDLPILLYHHLVPGKAADIRRYEITVRQFEEHLDILADLKFETIDFQTLLGVLDGAQKPRKKTAIITFDDAFRSFYELALPALKSRGMRATVFVPAGLVGATNEWDRGNGIASRDLMTAAQLSEITANNIEIGSHGWVHRSLPDCSAGEADEELIKSRNHLRDLGLGAEVFAYPYGRHSKQCEAMVEKAGYRAAVSIFSEGLSVTANRFAMRRIYVHPGDGALRFRFKLTNAYLRYKSFRERRTLSA